MAQIGWVFLAPGGGRYRIGLYHGKTTGHVLIHVNGRITKIDFGVKEGKDYSFFIEDEWVTIEMDKTDGAWTYAFHQDQKIDTPANRHRRKMERAHLRTFLIYLMLFALIIFVLIKFVI